MNNDKTTQGEFESKFDTYYYHTNIYLTDDNGNKKSSIYRCRIANKKKEKNKIQITRYINREVANEEKTDILCIDYYFNIYSEPCLKLTNYKILNNDKEKEIGCSILLNFEKNLNIENIKNIQLSFFNDKSQEIIKNYSYDKNQWYYTAFDHRKDQIFNNETIDCDKIDCKKNIEKQPKSFNMFLSLKEKFNKTDKLDTNSIYYKTLKEGIDKIYQIAQTNIIDGENDIFMKSLLEEQHIEKKENINKNYTATVPDYNHRHCNCFCSNINIKEKELVLCLMQTNKNTNNCNYNNS